MAAIRPRPCASPGSGTAARPQRPCDRLPMISSGSSSRSSSSTSSAARPRHAACRASGGSGSSSGGASPSGSRDGDEPPRVAAGSVVYRAKAGGPACAFPLTVPLLPFPPGELLAPGSTKILHLYEARYLALLERVLKADHQVFGHVVVEQPIDPGSHSASKLPGALVGSDFALTLGTLVQIVEVKAQGVGALVRIQAEGRIAIDSLTAVQPYIVGTVSPLLDDPVPASAVDGVLRCADSLNDVLRECSDLCAKFGGAEAAALQQALLWAERRPLLPGLPPTPGQQAAAPEMERAQRLSWAALSALPQASESELRQLLRTRLSAMAATSTLDRLQLAATCLEGARAMLAARVALKSLNIGAS